MKYKFFLASGLIYVMNYCFHHINIEVNDCWIKIDLDYSDTTNKFIDYKQACIRFNMKEVFFSYDQEDNSLKKALAIYLKSLYKQFNNLILIEGL